MTQPLAKTHQVRVHYQDKILVLIVESGQNLRTVLQAAAIPVYGRAGSVLNCGGRGICASCGVLVYTECAPTHWHDRLADTWGYPRLSCQIHVHGDIEISIIEDKVMWGQLLPGKKKRSLPLISEG